MDELTKSQKKALRELAHRAYAEALRRALLPVGEAVEAWKAGTISSFELSDRIHTFHQGPSRKLWSFYTTLDPRTIVVHAIAEGILDIAAVPEDLRAEIQEKATALHAALEDES